MQSILELDDDSLEYIFSFLTIYELIEVEKVSEAFKVICENVYEAKRFHKMRFKLHSMQPDRFEEIMDRVGGTLRSLEFSGGYIMDEKVKDILIEGVTSSARKLKSLTINYMQFTSESFSRLQNCFVSLTFLDLSRCAIEETLLRTSLDGETCQRIKTLKLAGNSGMTGAFFRDLNNVEHLDVSYCFALCFDNLLVFLQNCFKLKTLDLTASCHAISDDGKILVTKLLLHQPNIETLIMNNTGVTVDAELLSQFRNLKHASFVGRKFGT